MTRQKTTILKSRAAPEEYLQLMDQATAKFKKGTLSLRDYLDRLSRIIKILEHL